MERFFPAIKWAWVLLWKYFGRYYGYGSSWNSCCLMDRLTVVSFIRILKLNSLRHERFFSFVGKFTWRKKAFLLNLQKSNQHIEMKNKLDIKHLKKYLIWNFHLVWPVQFREWSGNRICGDAFYNKISFSWWTFYSK